MIYLIKNIIYIVIYLIKNIMYKKSTSVFYLYRKNFVTYFESYLYPYTKIMLCFKEFTFYAGHPSIVKKA